MKNDNHGKGLKCIPYKEESKGKPSQAGHHYCRLSVGHKGICKCQCGKLKWGIKGRIL